MFAVILYYQVICHQLQIQFDGDWQLSVTIGHCHLHKAVHLCMITYMADIHVRQMEKRIKRLRNYKKTIHVFGRKQWRIYIVKFWTRPPPGVQILSISCSFWENLAKSYVGAPPGELAPPPRGNPGSATGKECLRCKNVNKLDMKIQLYGRQVPTCVNNEENFEEFPLYLESHVLILY